jgi:hypothetical protein
MSSSVAEVLSALGLTETAATSELERLNDQALERLVDACAEEARTDLLAARLARLAPEHYHPHLDAIDPGGALAPAFDGAPWDRVRHWAQELDQHKAGLPDLQGHQPADALAAALTVLGRCGSPPAFQRIERWLTWATPEQVEAAERVLATVGVGIAAGRRAMEVWRRPAWRLVPGAAGGDAMRADARTLEARCEVCDTPLVVALELDAEVVSDLGVAGPRLQAVVCPSCLGAGRPSLVHVDGAGPRSAALLLKGAKGRGPKVALPVHGPLMARAATFHGDPEREDREALFRLGGAPTHRAADGPVKSAISGAPHAPAGADATGQRHADALVQLRRPAGHRPAGWLSRPARPDPVADAPGLSVAISTAKPSLGAGPRNSSALDTDLN